MIRQLARKYAGLDRWRICRSTLLILLLSLKLTPSPAFAANVSTGELDNHPLPGETARVDLGDSAVELVGPWRFHTGDDLTWARPDFDDAAWDTVSLAPTDGAADPDLGVSDPVAGWSARGYPGYAGYAWYRLRVSINGAHTRLALKMPDAVDDAYQIFFNGQLLGQLGQFGSNHVTPYPTLPRSFRLPKGARDGPATIAIRVWMDNATRFSFPDAGGLHMPPVLGHVSAISNQLDASWMDTTHLMGIGMMEEAILLLTLVTAITHFSIERTDEAYLYLGLVSLATLLSNTATLLVNYSTLLPQSAFVFLVNVIAVPMRVGLWVLFWASWFGLGPSLRFQRIVWTFVGLLILGNAATQTALYGPVIPVFSGRFIFPFLLTIKLLLAALLLWKSFQGLRHSKLEGWLALPAILLAIAANYNREAKLIHLPTSFTLWKFDVQMGSLSTILSLMLVTAMMSRRFLQAQRRSVQWGLEVEQAREVQQLLVPRALPDIEGLRIESEYRPAREVGGDFFQIIPGGNDGSLLIVVGDVTGKGLCAGMLVALIVGVVQTAAKDDPDPVAVLRVLNERLCERAHSTATCLAMRVTAAGEVLLANAGHLPPYVNGREMEMEGAFPLGIVSGLEFPVTRCELSEGDRLVLISDGVVEAQNADGSLFGFARVSEMLREPISAATLAGAAQQFGQEDDILVLSVERRVAAVGQVTARSGLISLPLTAASH